MGSYLETIYPTDEYSEKLYPQKLCNYISQTYFWKLSENRKLCFLPTPFDPRSAFVHISPFLVAPVHTGAPLHLHRDVLSTPVATPDASFTSLLNAPLAHTFRSSLVRHSPLTLPAATRVTHPASFLEPVLPAAQDK